jgi:hypothetical protein
MTRYTGMLTVLLVVMFVLTACGGVKVAEPQARFTDTKTGETITDSVELLEKAKEDNPKEYTLLYELSKKNPELAEQFIDMKSKELFEETNIEIISDSSGKLSETEFLNLLKEKYNIEANPTATLQAYYSALAEREFKAAFDFLDPTGIKYAKYGNPDSFQVEHYDYSSSLKITSVKIERIKFNDFGDSPVIEIGYRVQGFSAVQPEMSGAPDQEDILDPKNMPKTIEEAESKTRYLEEKIDESWEYTESGIAWVTLTVRNNKWFIHDMP